MSDNKKDAMPAFPDKFVDQRYWSLNFHYEKAYEHTRAESDAWEARCRIAEAALRGCVEHLEWSNVQFGKPAWDKACEVLRAIGPLPELPPSSERG